MVIELFYGERGIGGLLCCGFGCALNERPGFLPLCTQDARPLFAIVPIALANLLLPALIDAS